ncbi:MAG TPA: transglutaminase-like domain-containing protein, partial [Methanospirillum sp.]|nr:transglutaminase-like domain-containing protein [Methanospirillum sp.]
MSLNQTSADEAIRAAYPEFTSEERKAFLEPGASIQFESDGKVYYYEGIVRNIRYHNATLSRDFTRTLGESPFFDQVSPYISAPQDEKNPLYHNHTFLATGLLSIARDLLPGNGTLQVWVPLPVSTDSQSDIQVTSVVPEKFVVSGPVTTGEIGEVYLEIPLEEVTDEHVNVSVTVSFTTSPRITKVDPDLVQTYDISGPLYQRYTKSQPNINITPEIITLAQKIVGDETDPYKKARLIYDYIIETLPYSNVPHSYITAMSIPESDFVHNTGFGDCGTQSAYFAALCRASGIPARAPGGYQIVPGHQGTHFWAEF